MFETALRPDAQRYIETIGEADILVGIPSYKNAKTIGHVARATAEGMVRYFPDLRPILVNTDGGSTDDTMQVFMDTPVPQPVEKMATVYQGLLGKGSALRAIFEVAQALEVEACVVVEADLQSITPEWIKALASPIIEGGFDYVTPYYSRHKHEAMLTKNIAYPMTRMLYGKDIRQPIGGDFGLSGRVAGLYAERDVWETDVARAGIDIWMTTLAINEGLRICQAPLGTKTHDFGDPIVGIEMTFLQVVGTLFRLMDIYRRRWRRISGSEPIPLSVEAEWVEPQPVPAMTKELLEAFRTGVKRRRRAWQTILLPENLDAVKEIAAQDDEEFTFPADLWAKVLFDFAVVYNKGEVDPDKVVLALIPLYHGRAASFIKETEGMTSLEAERVINAQAITFEALKPYLVERWDSYVPWAHGLYEM